MLVFGVIYAVLIEIFLVPLLTAFGATAEIMPYAKEYTRITAIGMPFLIVNNGMSNLARADGSPKFSMTCMLIGAIINTILDPVFILSLNWELQVLRGQRSSDRLYPVWLPSAI